MRAIIIGDSIAMPRLECNYDCTWIAKLVKNYPQVEFIDKCRRSSSVMRLVNDGAGSEDIRRGADLLEYYHPDLVITQIGITDCSPRLLKRDRKVTKIVNELPYFISKLIYDFVRKTKGRTIKNNDLSPIEFKKCWINYIERAKLLNTQIICIKIGFVSNQFSKQNPMVCKSIVIYNEVLDELSLKYSNFSVIIPFSQNEIDKISVDGYHIAEEGHNIVYEKLSNKIDEFIEANKK